MSFSTQGPTGLGWKVQTLICSHAQHVRHVPIAIHVFMQTLNKLPYKKAKLLEGLTREHNEFST